MSGIVSKTEITDKLKPGIMVILLSKKKFISENSRCNNLQGGTYAGNAVACAAAIACADVIKEERVLENVQQRCGNTDSSI